MHDRVVGHVADGTQRLGASSFGTSGPERRPAELGGAWLLLLPTIAIRPAPATWLAWADPTGLGRAWSAGWTVRVPLVVGDRVLVPMSRIRSTRLSRLDNLVDAAARLSNRNLGSLETRVIPG